ncbi:hypothetical protein ACFL27_03250 [candidate division CSSED10-310 bacterium]|uniref:DUF5667 domain-containing protein n=1 Tax=candidate division CSSED10-310 bacterium TaxID=2855610 RepID=A0ABV6YSM1_UNCC1
MKTKSCLLVSVFFVCLFGAFIIFLWFFHIVKAEDGFHLVRKEKPTFVDIYLDTTEWGLLDYARYPQISSSLITGRWEDLSRQVEGSLTELRKQGEKAISSLQSELEQSDHYRVDLEKLQKTFQARWKDLKTEIQKAQSEEAIQKIKKEQEALLKWLEQELEKLRKKARS